MTNEYSDCYYCGGKVLKPEVAKAIDLVLHEKKKPTRTIEIPVYHYESDAPFSAPV